MDVRFSKEAGLTGEADDGTWNITPGEPIYCLERRKDKQRVIQVIDDALHECWVDAHKLNEWSQPSRTARVKKSFLVEKALIGIDELLNDVQYPDDYLEYFPCSLMTFPYLGSTYSVSSKEFKDLITPVPR